MHAHFRAAIIFQKVFSNGLKLNPMELCDCVTHWIIIFISDPSLTQLDLIIWFSLYLIKVACFETRPLEQLGVCVVVPKCHSYKQLFECQLSIIIVNCFHVFVNEIPTLHAYIHWTPAFEGASWNSRSVLGGQPRVDRGGGRSPFFNGTPLVSASIQKQSNTFSKVSCRRAVKNIAKNW